MKSYTVKQISEMLDTNPETVRRWIRDGKLNATQDSKKEGNVITQPQLEAFVKTSPKYFPKFAAGLVAMSPVVGVALAATGGIAAAVLMKYYKEKNSNTDRINRNDFKEYLQKRVEEEEAEIERKKELIQKIQSEITESSIQIEKYRYILKDDQLLDETIKATNNMTKGE